MNFMRSPPISAEDASEDAKFPFWKKNAVAVTVTSGLGGLCFAMAWPFIPLMVRDLGVTEHLETWVGNMMLIFYFIGFVINPLWGGLADHFGRKMMVLRASLGMGISLLIVPFATTPLMFACLFMIVGIFNGANSAANALVVANTPRRRIGSVLAYSQSGYLIGRTFGPVIPALLSSFITNYQIIFRIAGGMLVLSGLLVIVFVREIKQVTPGRYRPSWLGDLKTLLAVPRMGTLLLLCFIFNTLWAGNVTVMSIFALRLFEAHPPEFGNEAFWVSATAMGLAISSLVALPFWGRMLDRGDPARIMMYTTGAAILTHLPLLFVQTPLQLVLARVAFGLAAVAMQPALTRLLKDYAPEGMDARAISWGTSFQFMASGCAPFFAGVIGPTLGLRTYIAMTIALTALGLVLWIRSGRRQQMRF